MKHVARQWVWIFCVGLAAWVVGCSSGVPDDPSSGTKAQASQTTTSSRSSSSQAPPAPEAKPTEPVKTYTLPGLPNQAPQGMKKLAKTSSIPAITSNVYKDKQATVKIPGPAIKGKPQPFGLIAHEWGTYTSVSSSDGREMEGLQHEEEKLPSFVHHRGQYVKGMEAIPQGVTQKLETPVIYFYTKQAMDVVVKVDFPQGILSEWFPRAHSFQPPVSYDSQMPPSFLQKGSMTWKVKVDPAITEAPPAVDPDDVWAPSRQVKAAPLREPTSKQVEKFIFYRGLGRFTVPFQAKASADGTITLINKSKQPIPAVFVLHVTEKGAVCAEVGGIGANQSKVVQTPTQLFPHASYIDKAMGGLVGALQAFGGLYYDEAKAMVNTWRHSYFKSPSPGLRILYIAPRAWTDALLPLQISPKPSTIERVLVGRVELLTPQTEKETLQRLTEAFNKGMTLNVSLFGRFAEPKLRRALEQITDPRIKAYTEQFVQQLSWMRYR
ncbi:MAG: hypothetical protein EP343_33270 [Deltaproteobacteria bacterium]|nr:MAG: hypothetical protein EP343_33270 [Deltaproteobacteria bacterium]